MVKTKSYTSTFDTDPGPGKEIFVRYKDFKNENELVSSFDHSYALVLFESGQGIQDIDAKTYPIAPKQFCVVLPEQKPLWKFQDVPQGQILLLKRALIETFPTTLQFSFSPHNPHPVLDLDAAMFQRIEAEFLAIKKELSPTTIFMELVNARCLTYRLNDHPLGRT
ncbi:hypothetical protein [Pedobacter panaciterrae]